MYTLVIGRSYPENSTGMMGIFEFEQAKSLNNNGIHTIYMYSDIRSIKKLKKYGFSYFEKDGMFVTGHYLPIGGIPRKIFNYIKSWHFKKNITQLIQKHGMPNLVHVHYPLLSLTDNDWNLIKSLNIPVVVTEHWSRVQTNNLPGYRRELLKKIVDETDALICVGDLLKDSIKKITKTKREILVIPNIVSNYFYYEEKKKLSNEFFFIAIGRLIPSKRFDMLIKAFAKAFSNNKEIKLTIVGNGPEYINLEKCIEQLDMQEQIKMLGFLPREKTAQLMRNSDVYVSASNLETFGVPVIEAMMSGKPVIVVENSPIKNYINDRNGLLFGEDSIEELQQQLINIYENRRNYNGREIYDYANDIFSEKAVVNKLKSIYEMY